MFFIFPSCYSDVHKLRKKICIFFSSYSRVYKLVKYLIRFRFVASIAQWLSEKQWEALTGVNAVDFHPWPLLLLLLTLLWHSQFLLQDPNTKGGENDKSPPAALADYLSLRARATAGVLSEWQSATANRSRKIFQGLTECSQKKKLWLVKKKCSA